MVGDEIRFIFNTFSFLIWGGLVMWMAAGFTMLESGSVRTKNAAVICLKNIGLYSVAGIAFYLIGYNLMSRLRNSWGWRLGAVLNSPGKHPFALDRRLDAGSGGPAARREVEVGLFRRVADRASEHRWVTDAGRAPRGVAGGALVMSPGVRAGRR